MSRLEWAIAVAVLWPAAALAVIAAVHGAAKSRAAYRERSRP